MRHVTYKTSGVCSRQITFDLDDFDHIHNLTFVGGCQGNLTAISKLVDGMDAREVANVLRGNHCGPRETSCADQLAQAILNNVE